MMVGFTCRNTGKRSHAEQLPEALRRLFRWLQSGIPYRVILDQPELRRALAERGLSLSINTLSKFRHSEEYRYFLREEKKRGR